MEGLFEASVREDLSMQTRTMSRIAVFVCFLMLATAVMSAELPGGLKLPTDAPKLPDTPKLPDAPKAPDAKALQDLAGGKS